MRQKTKDLFLDALKEELKGEYYFPAFLAQQLIEEHHEIVSQCYYLAGDVKECARNINENLLSSWVQ